MKDVPLSRICGFFGRTAWFPDATIAEIQGFISPGTVALGAFLGCSGGELDATLSQFVRSGESSCLSGRTFANLFLLLGITEPPQEVTVQRLITGLNSAVFDP
jgi:hypothetical protein